MKKFTYAFIVLVALAFVFAGTSQAQNVTQWGKTAQGKAWPIINSVTAGDAGIGNGAKPTGWATIRGGFTTLEATVSQAVVVSGQMEFVGGGGASAYTWLRYALTFQDSSKLINALTDSALWVHTVDSLGPKPHSGYSFQPRTGTGTMSNGNGGAGTVWTINNGSWTSTWGNNGGPISAVKNAPRNAVAIASTYNWAISVISVNDTVNEIRWYMVEKDNKYWFGGTVQAKSTSKQFNGVNFGFNNDLEATQVNFTGVTAQLSDPITVPPAPWQSYYVEEWGKTAQGKAWPILWQDTTGGKEGTLVGDAGIGNDAKPTGWATIRGGFGDPVAITTDKAIIVSGKMEFVGGGGASAYTWLRYALTFQDSSKLKYRGTDSALWSHTVDTLGAKPHSGYSFQPRTGTGTMSNGNGGAGTVWTVSNGSWASTWGNNGGPISAVKNAPRNAVAIASTYNWAISVISVNDTVNEIRWYMVEKDNKYWFGGTVQAKSTSKQFNGVNFGFNNDFEATKVNFSYVKVDKGVSITVPPAPWQSYYVEEWGKTAQGKAWPILWQDTTGGKEGTLVGDAGIGNDAKPTGWATIRGGFGDPVAITTDKAIIVSGKMEFVGGGGASAYTWLRYALTFQDSSKLKYRGTDSALWSHTVDTLGAKPHSGYSFQPRTGTGTMSNGNGGAGTVWTVSNGSWASTWGNNGGPISAVKNAPRNAVAIASTYNWAISVISVNDTVNEIRWYMVEKDNKYWFGGTVQAKSTSKQFNGVNFGFNNDFEATKVNFSYVKVDKGVSITVPPAPWQSYYVEEWGKTAQGKAWPILWQDTTGGKEGTLVGDAGIGNDAKPTGWATIRGGFGDPVAITTDKAIIVSGKMEFVGGGGASAYTWLRYALTFQDSSKLKYRGTDSALWSHTVDTLGAKPHSGYSFQPRTGTGTMSNGNGGAGTVWTVSNGSWASTWGNNGGPISAVKNAPRNAVAIASTYNWAISVISVNDTVNEIRWYMVEKDNKYWFGGTVQAKSTSKQFNGVNFGFNNDFEATKVNFSYVKVDKGVSITVPPAPWQSYYVEEWGKTAQGKAWPILWQDTTGGKEGTLVGDAGIGNDAKPTGWATIRGGFGDPVAITTDKAIIVSGKMEFVGGGGASAYTWLRYALTFQDSSKLKYRGTDSALWSHTVDTLGAKPHSGYSFQPRTGTGTMSNGNGGAGTVWTVSNGSWASTWGNNGGPISAVKNAPRNAVAIASTYNWAISVISVNDTVNEIRWYMVEKDNKYWFGGTVQAKSTSKQFNGVNFGFNNDFEATKVNFSYVKVDKGVSITVPPAPWQSYYVSEFGIFGSLNGGWKFQVDPDTIIGNAGVGGAVANTEMTALRGAIEPFTPTTNKGLKVTGSIVLTGGGFEAANSLRIGLLNGNAGNLVNDATSADGDSTRWNGSDTVHTGLVFVPRSGVTTANPIWGNSVEGSVGAVAGGAWFLPAGNASNRAIGNFSQQPTGAVAGAGTYNFALSVVPKADNTSDISFKLEKSGYHYAAQLIENNPAIVGNFNGIAFALNSGNTTTSLKVEALKIDTTTVPVNVGTVTGVQLEEKFIPKVFALEQNYPNPFNPSTLIRYDVPMTSQVKLTIYDILGRVVTTLVDQQQQASRYEVKWNASNLSSGIYFYRIDAKGLSDSKEFTAVKKLMLLK